MDESRTMVEFVDDPRHVGKLVEQALVELRTQALVELRTRSLVELGTRSLVGLRPVVETKREAERAMGEFATTASGGDGKSSYETEVLL